MGEASLATWETKVMGARTAWMDCTGLHGTARDCTGLHGRWDCKDCTGLYARAQPRTRLASPTSTLSPTPTPNTNSRAHERDAGERESRLDCS